jgi:4-diphosphocytidyl-2-C-methyl-D-erythritol kinase
MNIKSYAKVNLGLNIIAKRGDGYHEIDTLMARVGLHDQLRLEPSSGGIHLSVENAELPTGKANLAYRAAELYLQMAYESRGVNIHLTKNIPIAAGLGGGSSNAGSVLRALSQLYPSGVDTLAIARALGADIAFFVMDIPAARARGRGEKLEPVALPITYLVLANPGLQISAKDAYDHLQNFSACLKLESVLERLATGEEPGYLNALQSGVVLLYPAVREVLSALRKLGLRGVMMSGSGSTCFGVAPSSQDAQKTALQLQQDYPDWRVWATATC